MVSIRSVFRTLFNSVLLIIFKIIYFKQDKQKPLPPVNSDLLLLPAHVLAKKIRQGEVLIL